MPSVVNSKNSNCRAGACRRAPDAVAWALGSLEARAAGGFRRHLRDCAACAVEVERTRLLATRLRRAPLAVPSAGLAARVMAALPPEEAPRRQPGWWLPAAGFALAAALVVAAGILLAGRGPRPGAPSAGVLIHELGHRSFVSGQ